MGRPSRDKGARIERELAAMHAAIEVKAERVPLSGASRYQGNSADLDVYALGQDEAPLVGEVKAQANGEGFVQLDKWLGDADLLFLRRDRAEPLVCLPWRSWARLLAAIPQNRLGSPPKKPNSAAPPRVAIADDGDAIRLLAYEAGAAVAVPLDPARAVALAGRLLAAAQRRM